MTPWTVLDWTLAGLLLLQHRLVTDNLAVFTVPAATSSEALPRESRVLALATAGGPATAPAISVLIPARNEAGRIDACLESLRHQTWTDLEILVLDDGSTDDTADLVRAAIALDPRIRMLSGAPLAEGWSGKNHACHQLSRQARGAWWVFLDADVTLVPDALERAHARAHSEEADLFSVFPEQVTVTWAERLVIPLLSFTVMGFLPMRLAHTRPEPAIAAANGQFLAFRPAAYAAAGGHEAIRADLVEDLRLAQRVKAAGGKLRLADGTGWVRCRMYRDAREVFLGFAKNCYPAFGGRPGLFVATMSGIVTLYLAPWLTWTVDPWGAAVAIALGLALRLRLARRFRHPALTWVLHPLAIGFLVAIALDSARRSLMGRSAPWKGRTYPSRAD